MRISLKILILFLVAVNSYAAVPKIDFVGKEENVKAALGLPLANRIQVLRGFGPQAYKSLIKIAYNKNEKMENRWRAVTALGELGREKATPELLKAANSPEWFMKAAGLVSLTRHEKSQAEALAKKLISDPALMVRLAAVDTFKELGKKANADILWKKLFSAENFRNQQSLFIRKRILEALLELDHSSLSQWMLVLKDKDESLLPIALKGFEKASGMALDSKSTLKEKIAKAEIWYSQKK